MRLPLKTFLICAALIGAAGGMLVRAVIYRPHYTIRTRGFDGFGVEAMWKTDLSGKEEFLYLLAFPVGNKNGGGMSQSPSSNPHTPGVHRHPLGIYVQWQRVVAPNGEKCWVYLTTVTGGDVRVVPATSGNDGNVTRRDFDSLNTSALWKDKIYPALVAESEKYRNAFYESEGHHYPPLPTRSDPGALSSDSSSEAKE